MPKKKSHLSSFFWLIIIIGHKRHLNQSNWHAPAPDLGNQFSPSLSIILMDISHANSFFQDRTKGPAGTIPDFLSIPRVDINMFPDNADAINHEPNSPLCARLFGFFIG